MEEKTFPPSSPRRRARFSLVLAGLILVLGWALVDQGGFEDSRAFLAAHRRTVPTLFPTSDKQLEALTAAALAKQGTKLEEIEPAAGKTVPSTASSPQSLPPHG